MADNELEVTEDSPHSQSASTSARVSVTESEPHAATVTVAVEHLFQSTTGPSLSNPLNTLEDAGWEENPEETKAWFDGTNDALTVGWSYSTDDPRSGVMSGKAEAASNNFYLYNRTLMPVHEGEFVHCSAWVKASVVDASTGSINLGIDWLDAGQVSLGIPDNVSLNNAAAASYVKLHTFALADAPAGAAYARFYLRVTGMSANEWYVDDCMVAHGFPGEIISADSDVIIHNLSLSGSIDAPDGELWIDSITATSGVTTGNGVFLLGSSSGYVRIIAPATVPSSYDFTVPTDDGTPGQVLQTDGSGTTSWATGGGYTNEEAQDAVGTILVDSATVDLTYTDATPEITASVKDDSITYAKMQNVSATDKLLGRQTAGAGDVEEIPCTAAGRALLDDANAAAQRTTLELDTASTPQFARVGVGAAAGAGGTFVTVNNALDTITTEIGITASAATGNVAGAVYRASADVAQTQFGVWASSRTTSRFGVTIGGWAELIAIAGNGAIYGTFHNAPVIIGVNALARMRFETTGNVKLAGTATRATTEGTNHLDIFNGTAPVGTLTNGISLYSTAGELRVMDAAGNPTLLSPHDENNNWIFDSHVGKGEDKKRIVVDMEKMVRFLNNHFGKDWVHEYAVAGGQVISQPSSLQVGRFARFLNSLKGWVLCCISRTKV